MRIGVLNLEMTGWSAGAMVSQTMARSLRAAGATVIWITGTEESLDSIPAIKPPAPQYFPGEWTFRKLIGAREKNSIDHSARQNGIQVMLPLVTAGTNGLPSKVGWIPDFQHLHLPHLYTEQLRVTLDRRFLALAQRSDLMLFSSEDSAADFRRFFPECAHKARVASFPSLFAFAPPTANAVEVCRKFHLPEKFLLVINQFWRHKNHRVVAEAIGILRRNGLRVTVVMAGMPSDYRDKENGALSETLQVAAAGGCWNDCVVLGKLTRPELEGLLRAATALVQPSRFEGWNTSVEDAKAVGCPLFLSDLAVHREQCPGALGFFGCDNAQSLADLIKAHWESLPPRPNQALEAQALAETSWRAKAYGERLMSICQEAIS